MDRLRRARSSTRNLNQGDIDMKAIETTVDMDMPEAETAVRDALATQGFGVLTEIDVAATLKAKIGVERTPLKILGACNPHIANSALELDASTSLLLPCNVVLEPTADGRTRIAVIDPRELMPGEAFAALAGEAAERLGAALDTLAS
jgi:uncharacterized protein (DUF302 family)